MNIKTLYRRFRAWQLNPFSYQNHSLHVERCANCGTQFQSNYCPVCGQKSGVGPICWKTVRQGLMVIWGMDSRSLLFTLVQLLLRPGYLISDYISGKRQASFPPVKMLLIVAIAQLLAYTFVADPEAAAEETIKTSNDVFARWTRSNPGWSMMAISSIFLLPTWLMYRFSPKHRKHTLPEGFFIQVFMGTLISIIGTFSVLTDNLYILWLWPFYYLVAYRQLFCYGWWGTFWRLCICFVVASGTILNLQQLGNHLLNLETIPIKTILYANGTILFIVLIGVFFEYRKKNRKKHSYTTSKP